MKDPVKDKLKREIQWGPAATVFHSAAGLFKAFLIVNHGTYRITPDGSTRFFQVEKTQKEPAQRIPPDVVDKFFTSDSYRRSVGRP
jgi:hypothetical protein